MKSESRLRIAEFIAVGVVSSLFVLMDAWSASSSMRSIGKSCRLVWLLSFNQEWRFCSVDRFFFTMRTTGSLSARRPIAIALAVCRLKSPSLVVKQTGRRLLPKVEAPMCFFTAGMLADFLGRLSGETVAVMEVECRSKGDPRCRFLSAMPETLTRVYEAMTAGQSYEEALGT